MYPYLNSDLDMESRVEDLLGRLTLEEKISLCHGCSYMEIGGIDRLQIGRMEMADGPQGVRLEDGRHTTALPCGISLACSWDPQAAYEFGAVIGRESRGVGNYVSLGPGFNIFRTPLNGRNFEYYGEDPVLAGKIAAGYIEGCQDAGTAATPKHLALNNQEICRTVGSSNVDERTMRELYLTAFEIVTKESSPWMMMSSYNRINGVYASANRQTQQEIVKDEWGFDGVMVSDWGGAHDARSCALGGLDLEMGQGLDSIFGEPLLKLVQAGEIPESLIDEKVRRVIRLMMRVKLLDPPEERSKGEVDTPRHHRIARNLAPQGMVLLKNCENLLPLNVNQYRKIAVIGPNADYQHSMGPLQNCGGSGAVHPAYEITPLAGIRNYCEGKVEVLHAPGCVFANAAVIPADLLRTPDGRRGLQVEYFHNGEDGRVCEAKPFLTLIDENMNHFWSEHLQVAVARHPDLPSKDFTARWHGFLTPASGGPARLQVSVLHSRVRLKIDGKEVIDSSHNAQLVHGEYRFEAVAGRRYALDIELVAELPNPEFKLLWSAPGDQERMAAEAVALAEQADVVIFCGGTSHLYDKEAMGFGNVLDADIPDLELIGPQSELIQRIAAVNPNTVVVLTNGSVVNVEPWIDQVSALLETWYAGMEGGNAIADVLFGDNFPGGKLCVSWARRLSDYPCHANGNYPGVREGDDPHVDYDEGIFVGYRHFDRAPAAVRFPFGFGLSYAKFKLDWENFELVSAEASSPQVKLAVRVTNVGKRCGTEVVQLYVGDEACSVPRPLKELKGFGKVLLDAGESSVVELSLNWRDFAFWSPDARQWMIEPGIFKLYVGTSSEDIAFTRSIELK